MSEHPTWDLWKKCHPVLASCIKYLGAWWLTYNYTYYLNSSCLVSGKRNRTNRTNSVAGLLVRRQNMPDHLHVLQLLTPNKLGGTWRRICSPDIRNVSALAVLLRNRALHVQIDIYLLTYSKDNLRAWCRSRRAAPSQISNKCRPVPTAVIQHIYYTWLLCIKARLADRSSGVVGPRLWNMSPASLRLTDDYRRFRHRSKTNLFDWGCGA